jgi:hypothetical protein
MHDRTGSEAFMRNLIILSVFLSEFMITHGPARAVTIDIDIPAQRMQVKSTLGDTYVWPVSTARKGFVTPPGSYTPYSLQKMHYSRKYQMAPMPHSIFFHEGYAIHGTTSLAQLGRPASHGCVRLSPANAAKLFTLVQREGALITIHDAASRAKATATLADATAPLRKDETGEASLEQWTLRPPRD